MTSTHKAEFDLPSLRLEAPRTHIVLKLHNCSLLSIGQLTDAGYITVFDSTRVRIFDSPTIKAINSNKCILTGTRHTPTGMWHIDTPTQPNIHPHLANRIGAPTTAELVAFAHATLFSPALSTLEKALSQGFLTNFPGLTATSLRRHPPSSIPMTKGHLDQTRQNQRSTKPPTAIITPDDDDPCILPSDNKFMPTGIPSKTHYCFATIMEPTGQIYKDQTGRFISPSSNGNNYLMILYNYDSNFIFSQPFKNRTAACILGAYKKLHAHLCAAGLAPQLQRLDNECSTSLKTFMTEQQIDYQLVPSGVHR